MHVPISFYLISGGMDLWGYGGLAISSNPNVHSFSEKKHINQCAQCGSMSVANVSIAEIVITTDVWQQNASLYLKTLAVLIFHFHCFNITNPYLINCVSITATDVLISVQRISFLSHRNL